MSSTYSCPVCRKDQWSGPPPVVSLLILVSTVRSFADRKQKSSGSLPLCADCLAKILDGNTLPRQLREGIQLACEKIGVEVQRALPLKTPKTKKRGDAAKP